MKGEIYMSTFITNYEPNPLDFNYAPSAVFAVYYGVAPTPLVSSEREFKIFQALSDFTHKTRINRDCTIIEIWENGKVSDMHDALEKSFPHAVVSLLAN
jgi:hypothetical protein